RSDECTRCWLGYAGWRGTTCSCSGAFGLDVACSECTWRAQSKTCGTALIDKCTPGAKTCEGWHPIALNDPGCATKCGEAPDLTLNRCQNYCLPPRDREHPCSSASREQTDACVKACTERLTGKSEGCETCYFKYSAYLGQTCSCSGSSCE